MESNWQADETTTAARHTCADMIVGETYAFRLAAIGGSSGQSDWSVWIIRMAA